MVVAAVVGRPQFERHLFVFFRFSRVWFRVLVNEKFIKNVFFFACSNREKSGSHYKTRTLEKEAHTNQGTQKNKSRSRAKRSAAAGRSFPTGVAVCCPQLAIDLLDRQNPVKTPAKLGKT